MNKLKQIYESFKQMLSRLFKLILWLSFISVLIMALYWSPFVDVNYDNDGILILIDTSFLSKS
jgi:hypothetical protein